MAVVLVPKKYLYESVRDESMELIQNYISGDYVTPRSIDRLNLYNPATGEVYGELVDSNSEEYKMQLVQLKMHLHHGLV